MSAQWRVLQNIRSIWEDANARTTGSIPIIFAGDIFDIPCPDLPLIRMFKEWMSTCWEQVYAIPGQHDLRHHRISDVGSTGYGFTALRKDLCGLISEREDAEYGVGYHRYPATERETDPVLELSVAGDGFGPRVYGFGPRVYGFGWQQSQCSTEFLSELEQLDNVSSIAIVHEYVHAGDDTKYEGAPKDSHVRKMAKRFKGFEFLFCGDNHTPFEFSPAIGPMIINCGALQCRTIKQRDFVPSMVLLCEDTKRKGMVAVRISLPVDDDVWAPASVLTLLEKHQAALVEFNELSETLDISAAASLYEMLERFLARTNRSDLGRALRDLLEEVAK
jgi:DNA repair exonuclease SbcCD nuclease subunit